MSELHENVPKITRFCPAFNRKFNVAAASSADAHRAVPRDLDEAPGWEEERVVQGDWTVACNGKWHQPDRQREAKTTKKGDILP